MLRASLLTVGLSLSAAAPAQTVLLLYDQLDAPVQAFAQGLRALGQDVEISATPEYQFDGTNPQLGRLTPSYT